MKRTEQTESIHSRLAIKDIEELKKIALNEGRTLSNLIAYILKEYIKDNSSSKE